LLICHKTVLHVSIRIHPNAGKNFFLAGAQDNGTQKFLNPTFSTTTEVYGGDGALDLAIATEGTKFNGIEIWMNDGKGNFTPSNQKLEYTFDQLQFREFEVFDYDKDGYPDIFLNPWAGKLFKDGNSVFMDNLIWKNTGGTFGSITKGITIPDINPAFMKVFFVNNQITYMGVKGNLDGSITLNEINPNY
jgi:hypothetical protein